MGLPAHKGALEADLRSLCAVKFVLTTAAALYIRPTLRNTGKYLSVLFCRVTKKMSLANTN